MRRNRASVVRRREVDSGGGVTATDDFNRASSDDLGPNWTQIASRFAITSNQLAPDSSSSAMCRHVIEPSTDNLFSQVTFNAWSSSSITTGPAIHVPTLGDGITTTGEFYLFTPYDSSKTEVALRRHNENSSGFTTLGDTVLHDLTAGDVFRIKSETDDIVGYINGVEVIRRAKSLALLAGIDERGVGIYSTGDTSNRLDNWSGGDA